MQRGRGVFFRMNCHCGEATKLRSSPVEGRGLQTSTGAKRLRGFLSYELSLVKQQNSVISPVKGRCRVQRGGGVLREMPNCNEAEGLKTPAKLSGFTKCSQKIYNFIFWRVFALFFIFFAFQCVFVRLNAIFGRKMHRKKICVFLNSVV